MSRTPRKLIVLIPTNSRPALLNHTVKSVCEQAQRFGHNNVEIVVSDHSEAGMAQRNKRVLSHIKAKYSETPIHYYHDSQRSPANEVLASARFDERKAFTALAPEDGHWGSRRNRLALLAACHGGPDAQYLHLDDDTPLLEVRQGKLAASKRDVLGAFKNGLRRARAEGKRGFSSNLDGLPDATVSHQKAGKAFPKQKPSLAKPVRQKRTYGFRGPGRITTFELMAMPYPPYGINEDNSHKIAADGFFGELQYASAHPVRGVSIAHAGFKGPAFDYLASPAKTDNSHLTHEDIEAWKRLMARAAESARWRVEYPYPES